MQKVICPYCGRVAKYVDSSVIYYGHSYGISKRCCDLAKKSAGDLARAKFGVGIQFIGVRKAEGGPRSTVYKSCMADGKHGLQHFPLFWWSNDDKRAFERIGTSGGMVIVYITCAVFLIMLLKDGMIRNVLSDGFSWVVVYRQGHESPP